MKLVKLNGRLRIVRRAKTLPGVKEVPRPRQTWRIS